MTNAELIQKIKAEIERRIEASKSRQKNLEDISQENANIIEGHIRASLKALLSFLSTLESETTYDVQQYTPRPSVDIEDVARVQFASHTKVFDKKRKAVFDWEQFKEVAGIFYGFGKKDSSDTLESEKPMSQDGLEEEINRTYHDGSVADTSDLDHNSYENIARHFYDIGCRRTAEKYDEIEYNRQRAEESVPKDLEEASRRYQEAVPVDTTIHYCGADEDVYFANRIVEAFIAGAEWDRKQMMKEAVEGTVHMNWISTNGGQLDERLKQLQLEDGQKVRIIIVKEEKND